MRLKKNLILREVAGEYMIVNPYNDTMDMTQILSLNETAAWLWKQAEGKDFTLADLADWLCGEYDIDRATAENDVRELYAEWQKNGLTE